MTTLALAACLIAVAPPNPVVDIHVEGRGTIRMELFADKAPQTVAHFLDLIDRKFYHGILFHRVVPNWVAQAGDPKTIELFPHEARKLDLNEYGGMVGYGDGGSGTTIPFEDSGVSHMRGVVGMALEGPKTDTGDSQFFINLADNTRLDGLYCAFGKVESMEVVDRIRIGDKILWTKRVASTARKTSD